MKKLVLILAVALSANLMVAQSVSPAVQQKSSAKVEQMKSNLGLSAEQEKSIKTVLVKYMSEVEAKKAVRVKADGEAAQKAEIAAINKTMKSEVMNLLTDEQKKKAASLKK